MTIKLSTRGVLLAAALLSACDSGTTQPPDLDLAVSVTGFAERGGVLHLSVTRSGAPVPQAEWSISTEPAGALTLLGGDSARLTVTGAVRIIANAGTDRGILNLESARPPVVYFDRIVGGNRDIYRVDLDGQGLTRLTTDAGTDMDPTAAGGKVVFVSFRAGSADIWTMPAAGGVESNIIHTTKNETTPALSFDGQRVAYAYDGDLVAKLWTARSDGTQAARATAGFGFNGSIESSPAWAPTGNRLVFMSTAAGSADLYDFTLSGSPAAIAPSSAADVEPAWSPDGNSVAFVSTREGGNTDVYLVRVGNGEVVRLTTGAQTEGQPAWTADSRRLVYTDFGAGTRRLRWLDPAHPGISYPIETGEGRAENAAIEP